MERLPPSDGSTNAEDRVSHEQLQHAADFLAYVRGVNPELTDFLEEINLKSETIRNGGSMDPDDV